MGVLALSLDFRVICCFKARCISLSSGCFAIKLFSISMFLQESVKPSLSPDIQSFEVSIFGDRPVKWKINQTQLLTLVHEHGSALKC